jgi:hypothetical protein
MTCTSHVTRIEWRCSAFSQTAYLSLGSSVASGRRINSQRISLAECVDFASYIIISMSGLKTYIHTYIQTYIHTYIHTNINTFMQCLYSLLVVLRSVQSWESFTEASRLDQISSRLCTPLPVQTGAGSFDLVGRVKTKSESLNDFSRIRSRRPWFSVCLLLSIHASLFLSMVLRRRSHRLKNAKGPVRAEIVHSKPRIKQCYKCFINLTTSLMRAKNPVPLT